MLKPGSSHNSWLVGAYASSPGLNDKKIKDDEIYYRSLAELPLIGGLEVPFFENTEEKNTSQRWHRFTPQEYLKWMNENWNFVFTLIPGVMERLQSDPHEGLASTDSSARKKAIEFVRLSLESVKSWNDYFGRKCIQGVEIHSAPKLGNKEINSSASAFSESLEEILDWNWEGATVLIEHCDQYIAGSEQPAKGFLSLKDEISTIEKLNHNSTSAKVLINWGRSAIEGRSALLPEEHLQLANQSNVLGGLIFSGASVQDELYGHWTDSHAPFERTELKAENVERCLKIWNQRKNQNDEIIGLKMQALPKTLSALERVEFVKTHLSYLQDRYQSVQNL